MIAFRGVSFGYRRGQPVLAGVDLEIGPGLTLVVGPNGSGKSSLLKMAAGVEAPDRGSVSIDGHDLWRDEVAARRGLAYVPEQPDLTPYATLAEVLGLVCRLRGESPAAGRAALSALGLAGFEGRTIRELSLGQRRRSLLAAARIGEPRHVLLDEPLESLDRGARDNLLDWIERLVAGGALVAVVSHDIAPFVPLAARALTLAPIPSTPGRIGVAPPPRLLELPGDPAARLAAIDLAARGGVSAAG